MQIITISYSTIVIGIILFLPFLCEKNGYQISINGHTESEVFQFIHSSVHNSSWYSLSLSLTSLSKAGHRIELEGNSSGV